MIRINPSIRLLTSGEVTQRSMSFASTDGNRKNTPMPIAKEKITEPHAIGPENWTSSSPRATSAENKSVRIPSASVSHNMTIPRMMGHLLTGLV